MKKKKENKKVNNKIIKELQSVDGEDVVGVVAMMSAIELKSLVELLIKNKIIKEKELTRLINKNEENVEKRSKKYIENKADIPIEIPKYIG